MFQRTPRGRRPASPIARAAAWPFAIALLFFSLPSDAAEADAEAITDHQIEIAIERSLAISDDVISNYIDVLVNDGIVTLSGHVGDLRAAWRAKELTEATTGVRSVVNHIEITPHLRSDEELRADVVVALATDPATDSWEIHVQARGGKVTLTGKVDSFHERWLAERVTGSVRGVASIANELVIDHSHNRSDLDIKKDVASQLANDAQVDAGLVEVAVDEGVVTLSGHVGSAAERTTAMIDAWVDGARDVKADDLEVAWWMRDEMQRNQPPIATDDEIRDAIAEALLYEPRVRSFKPSVAVASGLVTLTGTVDNLMAKRAATQVAENTVGVLRVHNYMKVRPTQKQSDDALAARVRQALDRDPVLSRNDITVSAFGGKAYLYGTVTTAFDRQLAERVTARTNGVAGIANNLVVAAKREVPDDWELVSEIEEELRWSPFVDADEVIVSVDDGIATLHGTVDSWLERQSAEENAFEAGAWRVDNELELESWQ